MEDSIKYSTVREDLEESVSLMSLDEDTPADSFILSLSSTFTPVFKSSPAPCKGQVRWRIVEEKTDDSFSMNVGRSCYGCKY